MKRGFFASLLAVVFAAGTLSAAEEARLMRFPDISKESIVFSYGGDLWTVPVAGGVARQLTTHDGYERFAKFSPDGKWIAFTASYDGNEDVNVIPAEGGAPKRLTYHPSPDWVLDWHPKNGTILFRSAKKSIVPRYNKLFLVSPDGGFPEELPLFEAELTSFSPDGTKIAYNRTATEFRTWKRYRGGWQQDVWIYDLARNTSERITDYTGTDAFPMWHGDRIYFISDRDHTMNVYCYDLATKKTRKVTNHDAYDVKFPSLGPDAIVYENGGWLYVLDLATEKTRKVEIEIPSDRVLARPSYRNVGGNIGSGTLSKTGKRAVLEARGDVFTVPAEKGDWRNLTQSPGSRERQPAWSPDGKWIAYLSDKTGEYEIYLRDPEGKKEEIQLSRYLKEFPFSLQWSPDSKKLLFHDQTYSLYYIDIDEKVVRRIDTSDWNDIGDYTWSPDSKWVAFSKLGDNFMSSIYLYSLADGSMHRVTNGFYDDDSPCFDPGGKYLYFISSRSYYPLMSQVESNFTYVMTSDLCALTLKADTPSPLAPESDEEEAAKDDDKKDEPADAAKDEVKADAKKDKAKDEKKDEAKDETKDIAIDFEGLADRIVSFPVGPGNFGGLRATEGKVFYASFEDAPLPFGEDELPPQTITLHVYDLKDRETKEVIGGINGYDISADGKKLLYIAKGVFGITDAAPGKKPGDGAIDTQSMQMLVDPIAEWQQMFNEAWRLERDFFYDPNMHGVDWPKMKERHGQLVKYAAHREDVNYVIGELQSELCAGHAYIGGGDLPRYQRVGVGLLGCDYELDAKSGRYRIAKILKGRNWDKNYRAPLAQPGIDVRPGDYLLAVNGRELTSPMVPEELFQATVDKQTTIKVSRDASGADAKEYVVVPVGSEQLIRYDDWVETNRKKVYEATGGRVGYIHVPTTEIFGFNEFVRSFYSEYNKEGLIVDVRYNGGGWPPDQMIERLSRTLLSFWGRRHGKNFATPTPAPFGHMVCIINQYAGSGGDAFPFYFRERGLGPLIGITTWGGLVGYSRGIPLMDGGFISMPDFGFINVRGQWDVENVGVKPDIEVDQTPELCVAGHDPQLERAIEEVMKKIEAEPVRLPAKPAYPIRN